jgi:ferredoxin
MHIEVDRERCLGLGMCEARASDLFEVRADRSLVLRVDHLSSEQLDVARGAVESCPTEALSIVED